LIADRLACQLGSEQDTSLSTNIIKGSKTPYCPCLRVPEHTSDYPFHTKYIRHKHKLDAFSIRHILADPAAIRHTLNNVNVTGRFSHIYGDIIPEVVEENERSSAILAFHDLPRADDL
jgi:hypothetical protein